MATLSEQSLENYFHTNTPYAQPYLDLDAKGSIIVKDMKNLKQSNQKTTLCFVKYNPQDEKGFIVNTSKKDNILEKIQEIQTKSHELARLKPLFIQEPKAIFQRTYLPQIQAKNSPVNIQVSITHIQAALRSSPQNPICLTYSPWSNTLSLKNEADIKNKVFIPCFHNGKGIIINADYKDLILGNLPEMLVNEKARPLLEKLMIPAPKKMSATPLISTERSVSKMLRNSQKACSEHLEKIEKEYLQTSIEKALLESLQKPLNEKENPPTSNSQLILRALGLNKQILDIQSNDIPQIKDVLPALGALTDQNVKATINEIFHQINDANKKTLITSQLLDQMITKKNDRLKHLAKDATIYLSKENIPTFQDILHPQPLSITPLTFTHTDDEQQGTRKDMEDTHFYIDLPEKGVLTGVFDGHGGTRQDEVGGKGIADFVSQQVQGKLPQLLKGMNIHEAFTILFDQIQEDIIKHPKWSKLSPHPANHHGCTAVVCFIDKQTNLIYTATLGDSEANIYRKVDGKMKSIPLSCVRDWSSQKDALRAASYMSNPAIATMWPQTINPKILRLKGALNVSRAFGDLDLAGSPQAPGVITKPKITVHQMQADDTLILACDGLKDYVPESIIANQVTNSPEKLLAENLTTAALNDFQSTDNVTVLSIKCKTSSSNSTSSIHSQSDDEEEFVTAPSTPTTKITRTL